MLAEEGSVEDASRFFAGSVRQGFFAEGWLMPEHLIGVAWSGSI